VAVTDKEGRYTLLMSEDAFRVTAFDPFRISKGLEPGMFPASTTMVTVDIPLSPLETAVDTRPGIRNGGFELEMLQEKIQGWTSAGSAQIFCDKTDPDTCDENQKFPAPISLKEKEKKGGRWVAAINTHRR
jgi:hypothetical protein